MGARQTKRSVDISTTPKKEKDGVAEEKLEKIEDQDLAKVQNGTAHSENQIAIPSFCLAPPTSSSPMFH
ncbi:hypothetical protein O3M35_007901 [Rhynocoris fuscipes]|uniref:Death-associated protein 1 n=1 Tax=Rhynocoris fuscipes TaxID=488301 RepID=A0AAW1DEL5_9HEMI